MSRSTTLTPAGSAATDGRRARSERTRQVVLDSIVELIGAGEVPTTAEVAAGAGISERSLFRHFESRDGLFDAAIDRLEERFARYVVSVPPDGPLETRLDELVAVRARLFEAITPMRRVAPVYAKRSDRVAERTKVSRDRLRGELARTLAPELAALAGRSRRDLLDLVDLVLSWEAWEHLRLNGASVPRARRLLALAARSVLDAEQSGRSRGRGRR